MGYTYYFCNVIIPSLIQVKLIIMRKLLFLGMMLVSVLTFANEAKYDTLYVNTEAIIKIKLDSVFNIRYTKDTKIEYFNNKIKIDKSNRSENPVMLCITTPTPSKLVIKTRKDYQVNRK